MNQITGTGGRKKRSTFGNETDPDSMLHTLDFIRNGGVDVFMTEMPTLVLPSLVYYLAPP